MQKDEERNMREYIYNMFGQTKVLDFETIALQIIMAAILGIVIYFSYFLSHIGTIYSRKFNTSLLLLTILTATVMTVIGNNIALSLGMVGALSIVRFRTAVKDSRDTVYIFWTIIVGICCGVGDFLVAAVGSAVAFFALLLLGRLKNDNRILLILRGRRASEAKIEALVFDVYRGKALMRVKNTTQESIELIYEISREQYSKSNKASKSFTEAMYEIEGIEYVNVVAQNDEISG